MLSGNTTGRNQQWVSSWMKSARSAQEIDADISNLTHTGDINTLVGEVNNKFGDMDVNDC